MQKNYYEHNRNEMLEFIPSTAKKVLEVGCGAGSFSLLVKEKLNAEIWGIELNRESAKKAGKLLDTVIVGDIVEKLDELPKDFFDTIVFNDVLEHLVNPEDVLKKIYPLLANKGVIVCSIPNVRYFFNLYELLIKKDWEYKDAGILDKTHLRFFTKKSIIRMFDNSPYNLVKIVPIQPIESPKFFFVNLLTLFMHQDIRYLQFAVVVRKDEN